MKKYYNWGILGAGAIARTFVRDLRLLPNARVHAVGSRSGERAGQFAAECGIDRSYGRYEQLAEDPAIDIVYVASRHTGHYRDTLLCLDHGKAVLCEKPVAINAQQLEMMIDRAKRNNCFFMEALWTRFLPSFIKCRKMALEGAIGKIELLEADFCMNVPVNPEGRLRNPAFGGGSLLDIGIYPLFFASEIGGEVADLQAIATRDGNGIDTTCSVLLAHKGGAQSMCASSIVTGGRSEALIHGGNGLLRLNRSWYTPTTLDCISDSGGTGHFTFEEPGSGYSHEAAEVMRCLDQGRLQSRHWSWDHSRNLITLLDRVRALTGIRYPKTVEAV